MMDAKTAVEILKSAIIDYAPPIMGCKPISIKRCDEIADYIENQEKYAELGRLAVGLSSMTCRYGVLEINNPCCNKRCTSFKFCVKRAELLKVEVKQDENI